MLLYFEVSFIQAQFHNFLKILPIEFQIFISRYVTHVALYLFGDIFSYWTLETVDYIENIFFKLTFVVHWGNFSNSD